MPRVTIDVSDEHAEWLLRAVSEEQRSKSEIIRDLIGTAISGPQASNDVPVTQSPGQEYGPLVLSAIEHFVHRYLIDHPKEGETSDKRLMKFRKRYRDAVEYIND